MTTTTRAQSTSVPAGLLPTACRITLEEPTLLPSVRTGRTYLASS